MPFHNYEGTCDITGAVKVAIPQENALVEWEIYQISVSAPNPITNRLLASIFINGTFLCSSPKAAGDTADGSPNIILSRTDDLEIQFTQGNAGDQVSVGVWYNEVQAGTSVYGGGT